MADTTWKSSTRANNATGVDLMTTDLNSLASGSGILSSAVSSGVVENATSLDLYADLELTVTFGTAPAAGGYVELFWVRTVNGTNYEDTVNGATPVASSGGYVDRWNIRAVNTAQRLVIPEARLPARDFKLFVINRTNQPFPASGSKVVGFFYRFQSN